MFLAKKIFSRILFPLPLCLEILLAGLLLLWFTRKQKTGKTLVALAGVLLFLFGSRFFPALLLTPLESKYAPLLVTPGAPAPVELGKAKFIVVLASGFADEASIARLAEGIRVGRAVKGCKLVLSGGPGGASSPAEGMAQLAEELGVGRQDMILETQSRDTEDEARLVGPIVGEQPFVLVTEASHMPRAMALFRKLGTHPIADPMGFRGRGNLVISPDALFPSAEVLRGSERAVYEYLGLVWEKIRGKI
jgi:uncharacterized SAM-binding protein YcdF (DUF218 family)